MADVPELSYGIVRGRFLAGILDTADAGVEPDGVPLSGHVIFSATADAIRVGAASPNPVTVIPQKLQVFLDSEGYLAHNGSRDITLWATDDTSGNPVNWQWKVSFFLKHITTDLYSPGFNFELPSGATVDLTTVAPTPGTETGVFIITGPQGPPGGDFTETDVRNTVDDQILNYNSETDAPLDLSNEALIDEIGSKTRAALNRTFVAVEGEPSDGDAIVWDESAEQWIPAAVEGGGTLSVLPEAEGDAGTATTARAISAERLKQQIEQHGITVIPGAVVRGVIVETGSEARPAGADVVIWVNPEELTVTNALSTDPIIVPGAGGGSGGATTTTLSAIVPPVASRWIMPPLVVNKGHDTTANGMMSLYRIEFTESVQITGLATDVFGDPGGSTVIRMGIYDSLTATAPISGTEKTVAASTGGNKIDTSLAVTLPAGVYWVACVPQGADAGVRHLGFPTSYHFWEEAHNALQLLDNWGDGTMNTRWVSGVTGALPNLSTATLLHETTNPLAVALRIG